MIELARHDLASAHRHRSPPPPIQQPKRWQDPSKTNSWRITMRRVIVPALLAVALVASTSSNASAFGLLEKLCKSGCDTGCAAEPACGCEVACEPACGCEVAVPCGCAAEPMCGCEVVDPCGCDSGCKKHGGLLAKLFGHRGGCGCDAGCCDVEPACGCEVAAPCCAPEPACGCEIAAPACGCEVPACDSCCGPKKSHFGLLKKLFSKKSSCGCDMGCAAEPTCGCGFVEPACGCEVAAPCGCN
ncbi:hypothetical protein Enr13x_29470 [Stieleria neptunia]|uniref:Keratin-like protein n=1 Tax=Stieleria neptunia TaxID=2527979 RepID=A0A518HQG9_9BACT|nr:hypothetical protein Enr13x_29470 [Stieleria neptunia]